MPRLPRGSIRPLHPWTVEGPDHGTPSKGTVPCERRAAVPRAFPRQKETSNGDAYHSGATTAEVYLELLKDRGIDVFLGNAGRTSPRSWRDSREAEGHPAPRPCHEFVAVSMAHGYYLGAGRPPPWST